jgi:hypothetical protein
MRVAPSLLVVWVGLTVVAALPTAARGDGPRRVSADRLRAALEAGFEAGAEHVAEFERLLASAERVSTEDPRVAYGAGLVLLKRLDSKRAASEFERVVTGAGEPYWPAWEAWVWMAARGRSLPAATDRLQGLVERVMVDPEGARERIVWCGRVLAALRQGETSAASKRILDTAEQRIRETLGPDGVEDFETGIAALERTVDELSEKARKANEAGADRKEKAAAQEAARLDGSLEKAAATREENERSLKEWKAWLDEQLKPIDKELAVHEKDFEYLSRRRESVNQSITLVGREITQLELSGATTNSRTAAGTRLREQLEQRNLQMAGYRNELAQTEGEMLKTIQAGNTVVLRRRQVVGRYEQATGQLVERQAQGDKWSDRLAARKARVKGNVAKPVAAKPRIVFSTLVPFDLDEKKRVLLEELAEE